MHLPAKPIKLHWSRSAISWALRARAHLPWAPTAHLKQQQTCWPFLPVLLFHFWSLATFRSDSSLCTTSVLFPTESSGVWLWGLTLCHLYWDGRLLSVREAGKNFLSVSMWSHQLKQYFVPIKKENSSWGKKLVSLLFLFWPMAQRVLVKYRSVYLRLRESLKLSLCKFWNIVLPLEVINTLMAESQNKGTPFCVGLEILTPTWVNHS